MHFSAFVASMLAANAMACKPHHHSHHGHSGQSTKVATPTYTPVYTPVNTPVNTPVYTPVYTPIYTPVSSAVSSPTTLVTLKKSSTSAAAQSTVETAAAEAVSTTTSASSSTSTLTSDEQNALDAQNAARADVGTVDLTWDADLAADALTWAKHLASIGELTHSSVSDQGENIYEQYSTETPLANAVAAFLDEKSSYNGEAITSTNYLTFGHYTQVVWKDTTKVGMASASNSNGETYVVARYYTPGNYEGETAY